MMNPITPEEIWDKYSHQAGKIGLTVGVFWVNTMLMTTYFDPTKNTFTTCLSITLAYLFRVGSLIPLCTWLGNGQYPVYLLAVQFLVFALNMADSFSMSASLVNEEILVFSCVVYT